MSNEELASLHYQLRVKALDKLGPKLAELVSFELEKVARPIRKGTAGI